MSKKVKKIVLNEEQQELCTGMLMYTTSEEAPRFFMVNAGGGTGKTTLVRGFIKSLNKYNKLTDKLAEEPRTDALKSSSYLDYATKGVAVTATTNTAVAELLVKLCDKDDRLIKGISDCVTIFSLIGLVVYDNFRTGKQSIKPSKRCSVCYDHKLIIIDEGSMLDESMEGFLDKYYPNARIIVMGDAEQLLSVGSKVSYFYDKYREHHEIFKNNRSNEKVFKQYVDMLRFAVRGQKVLVVPPSVGKTMLKIEGERQFLNTVKDAFSEDPSKCRVIAFTNSTVNEYIRTIRHEVMNTSMDFMKGDFVYNLNPLKLGKPDEVDGEQKHLLIPGNMLVEIVYKGDGRNELFGEYSIYGYDITISYGNGATHDLFLAHDEAKLRRTIKDAYKSKNYTEMFKMKNTLPMFRLPYASTIHKAQGASIDYVFIDLTDLSRLSHTIEPDTVARLVYVAMSRTKKLCYVHGRIPTNLLGDYSV